MARGRTEAETRREETQQRLCSNWWPSWKHKPSVLSQRAATTGLQRLTKSLRLCEHGTALFCRELPCFWCFLHPGSREKRGTVWQGIGAWGTQSCGVQLASLSSSWQWFCCSKETSNSLEIS